MKVPAVILAGGRATRMGGGDKSLLFLADGPGEGRLLDHVIARLSPQVGALGLNVNGDPARFAALAMPVITDTHPGHLGPLAGVLTAMDWALALGAAAVVTTAADTPFLPRDLVARLHAAAGPDGLAVAATRDADGTVRAHPTCGLWPVALRDDLQNALSDGQRKVLSWTTRHNAALAVFAADQGDPFFNVNTPSDLVYARQLCGGLRDV